MPKPQKSDATESVSSIFSKLAAMRSREEEASDSDFEVVGEASHADGEEEEDDGDEDGEEVHTEKATSAPPQAQHQSASSSSPSSSAAALEGGLNKTGSAADGHPSIDTSSTVNSTLSEKDAKKALRKAKKQAAKKAKKEASASASAAAAASAPPSSKSVPPPSSSADSFSDSDDETFSAAASAWAAMKQSEEEAALLSSADAPPPLSLHVTQLDYEATLDEVRSYFETTHGISTTDIRLCYDKRDGFAFRGVAFVDVPDEDCYKRALALHGTAGPKGRKINVRPTKSEAEIAMIVRRREEMLAKSKSEAKSTKVELGYSGGKAKDKGGAGGAAGPKNRGVKRRGGDKSKAEGKGAQGGKVMHDREKVFHKDVSEKGSGVKRKETSSGGGGGGGEGEAAGEKNPKKRKHDGENSNKGKGAAGAPIVKLTKKERAQKAAAIMAARRRR